MADQVTLPGAPSGSATVICVELNNTLIATELVWECILRLLRRKPWQILLLPFWLAGGKANLRRQLARNTHLDVEKLPYRSEVLDYIQACRQRGAEVLLVTDEDETLARQVARHLGCFTAVVASDGDEHLSGKRKRDAVLDRLGSKSFCYIGSRSDGLPLWNEAQSAVLVAPRQRLLSRVRQVAPIDQVFPAPTVSVRSVISALRIHQWVKNVLIFVPVLLDHRLLDGPILFAAALAFLAFSLAASGGYVLNDVLDSEADRAHPTKRYRPFAARVLSPAMGAALILALFVTATTISLVALPTAFYLLLLLYIVLTSGYSLYLKRIAVVDVMLLAGLYTLRILAGIAATGVRFSTWLLAFSMFLFLSLAFMKRYAEFARVGTSHSDRVSRRGYSGGDLDWLRSMGGSSGYLSVLVLALYISSDEVAALYSRPDALWLICPLLLFWISRMWFRAHRGKLHEDPIVATARDPASYGIGLIVFFVLIAAI